MQIYLCGVRNSIAFIDGIQQCNCIHQAPSVVHLWALDSPPLLGVIWLCQISGYSM